MDGYCLWSRNDCDRRRGPFAFVAKEYKVIYKYTGEDLREVIGKFQLAWQNQVQFIVNLCAWLNGNHGETAYFLTQLPNAHESFQFYLYKIGKALSPDFVCRNGVVNDADRNFFLVKSVIGFVSNFI